MHQNQEGENSQLVKKSFQKWRKSFKEIARFTVCDIAWKVGMSLSTVHFILKKHLKVRNIFARWVPHLLTDEQNRQRVLVAEKLLKMFQTNVVPGDENRVY